MDRKLSHKTACTWPVKQRAHISNQKKKQNYTNTVKKPVNPSRTPFAYYTHEHEIK